MERVRLTEKQMAILGKYFPPKAVPVVAEWIPRFGIYLKITKERFSKYGDFTLTPVNGMYRITVNGSLNPYAFLLTFVHEVAHLSVLQNYGRSVAPHGQQWKDTFRSLMLSLDLRSIYPHDILVHLADYLKNPKASSDRHHSLPLVLASYDKYGRKILRQTGDNLAISELSPGDGFIFQENKEFVLERMRRRLYLCREIKTGKQYLFQPYTSVRFLKQEKNNDDKQG